MKSFRCEDAEDAPSCLWIICKGMPKAVELAREKGIKVGLLRPITLYPFPYVRIKELAVNVKGFHDVEMNAGQMVEDVADLP